MGKKPRLLITVFVVAFLSGLVWLALRPVDQRDQRLPDGTVIKVANGQVWKR